MTKKSFWQKWVTVVITAMSLFVIVIDTTILNVSLTDVKTDLNTDLSTIQWAITIYALVMGAFLITGGKLGDIYGRKKMFMIGMVLYGIGTLIAALAPNAAVLIIGWSIFEGIGGALMMPNTQSLLTENYTGKDRALAMGVWGGVAGAGAAFGPIFGGYLTTNASWRWAFGLELVVVILVLALSYTIPKSKLGNKRPRLDNIGVALSSLGLASLVYGIIESTDYGWWKAKKVWEFFGMEVDLGYLSIVPVFILFGSILLGIFYWWLKTAEQKKREPLFTLSIFKSKQFNSSLIVIGLMALSQAGMMFTLAPLLQGVRGYSAFETGLAFLPMSIAMMISAPLGTKLNKFIKPKYLIQTGLIISIIAAFLIQKEISLTVEAKDLRLGMFLTGVGMGFVMAQIMNMVMSSVPKKEVGQASGLNSTVRQIGMALGTAILGTVLLTVMTNTFVDEVKKSEVLSQPVKNLMVNDIEENGLKMGEGQDSDKGKTLPLYKEINKIANTATVEANKETYYYTASFFALALIGSIWLPREIKEVKR